MEKVTIILITAAAIVASYTLIPDQADSNRQVLFGRTSMPVTLTYQTKQITQPCKISTYQIGRVTVQVKEEGDSLAC